MKKPLQNDLDLICYTSIIKQFILRSTMVKKQPSTSKQTTKKTTKTIRRNANFIGNTGSATVLFIVAILAIMLASY